MSGPKICRAAQELPELGASPPTNKPEGWLFLDIDRVTASRLGIAPTTIDNTLYDAFGQRQINTMYTQVNQYHVYSKSIRNFRKTRQVESNLHSG